MVKYRIEWELLLTGLKSNGVWFESKDKKMLTDLINKMNLKYKSKLNHWLGTSN